MRSKRIFIHYTDTHENNNFYILYTNTPEKAHIFVFGAKTLMEIIFIFGAQKLPKTHKLLHSAHKHSQKRTHFYIWRTSTNSNENNNFYIRRTNTPEDKRTETLKPHETNPSPACLPTRRPHVHSSVNLILCPIAKFREMLTFTEIVIHLFNINNRLDQKMRALTTRRFKHQFCALENN
jgi:hypothetical protein